MHIQVLTDRATLKPRLEDVSKAARERRYFALRQTRVFEARGEIFTVPAEHGVVRNLTRSSGVAERYPAWSPDGKHIAYFSDRSGEYELTVRPADGSGQEEALTTGPGLPLPAVLVARTARNSLSSTRRCGCSCMIWTRKRQRKSANSSGSITTTCSSFKFNWSKDSRWIAFTQDLRQPAHGHRALRHQGKQAARRDQRLLRAMTHPSSIRTASTCSTAQAASSRPSTATWTIPGSTRTRSVSWRFRCAKMSPPLWSPQR